ncbi:flagellar biosynthesis protein FlhA [Pseudomonas otitidis]|uniref:flagellar biosynthesis protein FlhA n=1 Tax=Pseudomonadaceae TaxID=135621 RepID=UPI002096BBD3|nr:MULTISPECIES: flagellar biosynthesis protein FlhA [Pseudomonas]MCO7554518.1 flagellar biosynthesis protein FlhA [Pseudomonas otitidis]MDH1105289.1 flagellar biosynthesis protein FlhA [Pseudomonas otitidis]MDH1160541.1 flagellar biosynthesis protein FlhA [Pseudomonas otitidis]MDH1164994.1 flagellar biosynthesis protein FlhA [Pseudomonas otitidis]MDU9396715.1 flagellar biosynthesis protein FlhA [Pseudomonas sp. zfem003]
MPTLSHFLASLRSGRIGIPLVILSVLAMIILPLPPLLLDALFTFNIGLAILVLMVSVSSQRPLDFSLLPTVILVTTLLRLSLNVASTRVVLLDGHTGSGAAGKVIEAFGEVVIGGNFIVGLVVFVILMIINFMVITKGGERISEVTARFTLDALPGKQMAIDADLNAGLLNQEQARERRREVAKEADFYGAMDGASKFVRGDAIAGILVLLINLFGGTAIGMLVHGMSGGDAFRQYALLTIGDGLVAQIPALLLSTAAAIIVTRVNESADITALVQRQLLASPSLLATVAGILVVLALVPGMPHLAFLAFAALVGFVAWRVARSAPPKEAHTLERTEALALAMDSPHNAPLGWEDLPGVERLGLSLGYKLVGLVNEAGGAPLPQRVRGVRQSLSEHLGFLLPEVRIRDNLRLKASQYSIQINGQTIESAEIHADRLMAIPSPELYGEIDGILATDPAYRMQVVWIEPTEKARALNLGYQVIDCASVIATHLNKVIRQNLPDLLRLDDVELLLQRLALEAPKLAETLRAQLGLGPIHRACRHLLQDEVPLRDVVTLATALLEGSESTKDPLLLAADARYALRRTIVAQIAGERGELGVFLLDPALENTLLGALSLAQQAGPVSLDAIPVEPALLNQLQGAMPAVKERLRREGHPPILTVMPQLRPLLARYARVFSPGLHVLSQNEIPERVGLKVVGTLG